MSRCLLGLFALGLVAPAAPCTGQNVSDYTAVAEPLLFLLREPAVQRDLALTAEQQELIAGIIRGTGEKVHELQQQIQSGETTVHAANELVIRARKDEQLQVLEHLSSQQRDKVLSLIGA